MLKGIFPMTYCFFNKNNSLDIEAIKDQIELIKDIGSHGIACLGLANEVNKLSFSEKKKIIELISNICNSYIPIAVTVSGKDISEYKKIVDVASQNNARWIIFQPLTKVTTTDRDCYNFFNEVLPLASKDIVIGIQNAKEYLGVGLEANQILKLYKKYYNFRAIKAEASAVLIQKEIDLYPKDLSVFNGRGGQEIVENLLLGCQGIVPSLEGSDIFLKIYRSLENNKIKSARNYYKKILPTIVFSMQSINSLICYGKRICAFRMGMKTVYDRNPELIPSDFGIKLSKHYAKELGRF